MKLYLDTHTDPQFNLAAEEYLITNAADDIIMLWRNEAAVIIGKNQNAYAEINFDFTEKNGVKVVRRLTGGGAVFHDLGNVNFTFISPKGGVLAEGIREGGLDFAHFTKPIINALSSLGIKAKLSGRNDIVVDTDDGERKVSGNAQCVIDGATLHHGTLLFSASLERLQGALNVDPAKLKSKGIASVRSRVANIKSLLPDNEAEELSDAEAFMAFLGEYLSREFSVTAQDFSPEEEAGIEALVQKKYRTDEWNLRRFATFERSVKHRFDFGTLEASMSVSDGVIAEVNMFGDFFGVRDISELSGKLRGVVLTREAIEAVFFGVNIGEYISGASAGDIAMLLTSVDTVS